MVHTGTATKRIGVAGVCKKMHRPESPVLNPAPVTDTAVEVGPETGETAMCGPVTTKLADPISPLLPFTETTYVPGVIGEATVKLVADNVPDESMEHETDMNRTGAAGDCRKLQSPASAVLNPCPLTETAVPLGPEVGPRVIVGAIVVTVKAAVAKSPLLPVTVIWYNPGVAVFATVKLLAVN